MENAQNARNWIDFPVRMGYTRYEICETNVRRKCDNHIMTQTRAADGYVYVNLKHDGDKKRKQTFHKVLAQVYLFNDTITKDHVVEHINGIRDDNALSNLKWRLRSDEKTNKTDANSKAVVQCTAISEVHIKTWPSARQAEEAYGLPEQRINDICRGATKPKRTKNSGQFWWMYAEDYENNVPFPTTVSNCKGIYQYDLQGNLVGTFKSQGVAAKTTGVPFNGISNACSGKSSPIYKDYIWKYTDSAKHIQARTTWEEKQANDPKLSKNPVFDPVPLPIITVVQIAPRVPIEYNRFKTFPAVPKDYKNQFKVYEGKFKVYANGTITKMDDTPLRYSIKNAYIYIYIKDKPMKAHRLICTLFNPNVENKPVVDHKNGDKLDNRADNLQWATHKENTDAYYAQQGRPRRNVRSKTVYKIDATGTIIGEYVSPTDAAITDNKDANFVKNQCYYGYIPGGERYLFEEEYNELFRLLRAN